MRARLPHHKLGKHIRFREDRRTAGNGAAFSYRENVAPDTPVEYGFDALRTRRCECGAAECTAIIEISWAEQDEVDHGAPDLWIVAPGHEPQGARSWRVVRDTDRFVVVEVEEAPV